MGVFGRCGSGDCPKDARWQIGFRIWPRGRDHTKANAVEGLTGVCVCDEHAIRDPDKFFTPRGKEAIEMSFLQCGKGMPDFSTAEIIHTEIADGAPITPEEAQRLGGFADSPS